MGGSDAPKLVDEIISRADGVFLWVVLVTKMLREGLTNADCISDLRKRLESIPTDLEKFFRHILEAAGTVLSREDGWHSADRTGCEQPLPLEVYAFHDLEYADELFAFKQAVRPFSKEEMQTFREPVPRRLNGRCKGLLEVREGFVEFLHRTVRDYLLTGQMMQFLDERTKSSFSPSLSAFKAYIAWIRCTDFRNVSDERLLRHGDAVEIRRRWGDTFRNTMARALSFAKAADEDESCRARCFELLDDLELSIETMALTNQIRGISTLQDASTEEKKHRRARSLFRELVIQHDLGHYVWAKVRENPLYFSDIGQPLCGWHCKPMLLR